MKLMDEPDKYFAKKPIDYFASSFQVFSRFFTGSLQVLSRCFPGFSIFLKKYINILYYGATS